MTQEEFNPTLSLVYLPHLDYNLQCIGPDDPDIATDLKEIDHVCNDLVSFYEERGTRVIILSEYGILPVNKPVSLNRTLRENGYITVREENGGEVLIPGGSRAFAVADHQIAHIYIEDSSDIEPVRLLLEHVPGVDKILDEEGKKENKLNHARAGELVAVAEPKAWFTYYYWLDDGKAPDFAPTVDIHTKPGYDPAELLVDPRITFPKLKAARRLLQKKLGFRYNMDLIPIQGNGVKGSHGRISESRGLGPVIGSRQHHLLPSDELHPADVHDVIMAHLFEE
jgi:predicted AlkP superfamily pyrophosphatase or phosphodiesterase